MPMINVVALILLIVGGLNWGLVGLFAFDLVAAMFGGGSTISRFVYVLIGLSALWCLTIVGRVGSSDRSSTSTARL